MGKQTTMTTEEYKALGAPRRTGRMSRKRTFAHGRWFDSKWEAEVYDRLVQTYGAAAVIPQVSMPIGNSGERIRVDFLVNTDDKIMTQNGVLAAINTRPMKFIDAKGHESPEWRTKANRFRKLYGIEIEVWKKRKGVRS